MQNREATPTTSEVLWEVAELASGAVVMFLPLLLLAVPGIALFVVLPGLVLLAVAAAPVVVVGAILAPIYLLVRFVRRWTRPAAAEMIGTWEANRPPRSRPSQIAGQRRQPPVRRPPMQQARRA